MQNKELLLNYIRENGKDKTWSELADEFGFSSGDVVRLFVKRKLGKVQETVSNSKIDNEESTFYNLDKGEIKFSHIWDHAPTPEEVIAHHKVDTKKWRLSNVWAKMTPKGYLTSALFSQLKGEDKILTEFTEFLKSYKSPHIPIKSGGNNKGSLPKGALIVNKQDFHGNKRDINGDNDIIDRFNDYKKALSKTLINANKLVSLEKIIYIVGSDEFNSEFTETTTKGTPQQNILPYNVSFNLICKHEVEIINILLEHSSNLEVVYLQGNHDEFVGFHMVSWLTAYYRNQSNLSIDMTMDCTKYRSVYDTALCINHGDVQKPERLAQNFPVQYKEGFAKASYWVILTGDKHTELSRSIGGIKFYQISSLSKASSHWDQKNGYDLGRAEMTSFLIEEGKGINYIIKEPMFKTTI